MYVFWPLAVSPCVAVIHSLNSCICLMLINSSFSVDPCQREMIHIKLTNYYTKSNVIGVSSWTFACPMTINYGTQICTEGSCFILGAVNSHFFNFTLSILFVYFQIHFAHINEVGIDKMESRKP